VQPASARFKAMGSPCEVRVYAAAQSEARTALEHARREVARLERKYTRYRDDSVTAAINRSAGDRAGIEVDAETAALLDYAETAWRESDGRFDPTSGVLRRAWDFRSGRLPEATTVREVLKHVGWQKLQWRRPHLTLPLAEMQLDFGGFVKEYAADRVAAKLRARGIEHGLVDLGGDIAVVGAHPDGSAWRVGIRNPHVPGAALTAIGLSAGGIATSGDYERGMWADGQRYGHILDPRTGWPVAGPASVSVIAAQCLVAGTAATVAVLHGEDAAAWLADLTLPHLVVSQSAVVSGPLAPAGVQRRAAAQRRGLGGSLGPDRDSGAPMR
jgi:thiamine biosynthesis lipoprotein